VGHLHLMAFRAFRKTRNFQVIVGAAGRRAALGVASFGVRHYLLPGIVWMSAFVKVLSIVANRGRRCHPGHLKSDGYRDSGAHLQDSGDTPTGLSPLDWAKEVNEWAISIRLDLYPRFTG